MPDEGIVGNIALIFCNLGKQISAGDIGEDHIDEFLGGAVVEQEGVAAELGVGVPRKLVVAADKRRVRGPRLAPRGPHWPRSRPKDRVEGHNARMAVCPAVESDLARLECPLARPHWGTAHGLDCIHPSGRVLSAMCPDTKLLGRIHDPICADAEHPSKRQAAVSGGRDNRSADEVRVLHKGRRVRVQRRVAVQHSLEGSEGSALLGLQSGEMGVHGDQLDFRR